MVGSTNTISINVVQQGAQQVQRAIEDIGRGAATASTSVRLLQGTLASLGVAAGLKDIVQQFAGFQAMQYQIAAVTDGLIQQKAAFEALFQSAQQARSALDANVMLYQRMNFAARDLKLTQQQMVDVTTAITTALTLQNTTAEQQRVLVNELTRALVEGTITARDWMALIRNSPQIIGLMSTALHNLANTPDGFKSLSENMSKFDVQLLKSSGSISTFRYLVQNQAISSQAFAQGFLIIGDQLVKMHAQLPATIGQAFIQLSNSLTKYIGQLGETTGASRSIVTAIQYMAENLDTVAKGATTAGAALLVAFGPAIIRSIYGVSAALVALVNRNPWLLLATAIAGIIAYIIEFKRESEAANAIVGAWAKSLEFVTTAAKALGIALDEAFKRGGGAGRSIGQFITDGFNDGVTALRSFTGILVGSFTGIGNVIQHALGQDLWKDLETGWHNLAIFIYNKLAIVVNLMNEAVTGILNRIPFTGQITGPPTIKQEPYAPRNPEGLSGKRAAEQYKEGFSAGFEGFNRGIDMIGDFWKRATEKAAAAGKDSAKAYGEGIVTQEGPFKFAGGGPVQGPTQAGPAVNATLVPNAQQIKGTLTGLGANDQAVAAFLGNFVKEAPGFDPTLVNPASGASNIAQWLGPRLEALKKIGDPKALATGLELLKRELTSAYSGALAGANSANTLRGSTAVVLDQYELGLGPNASAAEREKMARLASGGKMGYDQMLDERTRAAQGFLGGEVIAGQSSNPLENTVNQGPNDLTPAEEKLLHGLNTASASSKAKEELDNYERTLRKAADANMLLFNQEGHAATKEEERARLLGIITGKLQDQVNPLQALLRPLAESVNYYGTMDPVMRQAAIAADKVAEAMRKQGEVFSPAQRREMEEYVRNLERIKKVQSEGDSIFKNTQGGARLEASYKLEALNDLLKDGKIRADEYNEEWAKIEISVLEHSDSMFDGIKAGLLKVSSEFGTEAKIWEGAVTSAFGSIERAIEEFVTKGKFNLNDLAKSITADFAKAGFKGAMAELLGVGGGAAGGGGGIFGSLFGNGNTTKGGNGFGAGAAGGGRPGSGVGGFIGSVLGIGSTAAGENKTGGIFGSLFGGKDTSSPVGDWWLTFARGLKDQGVSDIPGALQSYGLDQAGMDALKGSAQYWGGFSDGGQFHIPGQGGTDTTPVSFMATPGERVTVETPLQQARSRLNGFDPLAPRNRGLYADGGDFVAGGPNYTSDDVLASLSSGPGENIGFDYSGTAAPNASPEAVKALMASSGETGTVPTPRTSIDALAKVAATSSVPNASPSADKIKAALAGKSGDKSGLGTWGWIALAGAGLLGAGYLGYNMLHKKKPEYYGQGTPYFNGVQLGPDPNYGRGWPNPPGPHFAEGGEFGVGDGSPLETDYQSIGGRGSYGGSELYGIGTDAITPVSMMGEPAGATGPLDFAAQAAMGIGGGALMSPIFSGAGGLARAVMPTKMENPYAGLGLRGLMADTRGSMVPAGFKDMAEAQKIMDAGGSADDAWRATLTGNNFADRMWRTGVSDSGAKLKPEGIAFLHENGVNLLSNIMEHPDLYDRVPGLADTFVTTEGMGPNTFAAYSPTDRSIKLNDAHVLGLHAAFQGGYQNMRPEMLQSILHETAHTIDHAAGFGGGFSPMNAIIKEEASTLGEANDLYHRTSGEVLARQVEARYNLDEAGQRNWSPFSGIMGPDVPLERQIVRDFSGNIQRRPGFAAGAEFGVSDYAPFGGAVNANSSWAFNENYSPPTGATLPSAAAFAEHGALTQQMPIGVKPPGLLESLTGMAGQFGGFASKLLFGGDTASLGSIFHDGGVFTVGGGGLPGFAMGGDFDVGGFGGMDSQLVAFKASPGEHVEVTNPGGPGGSSSDQTTHNHTWNITTNDADSFRRSQGQIATNMGIMIDRTTRRNA